MSDACGCTCGKPGCASVPGRVNRAGLTIHNWEGYKRGCRCGTCTAAAVAKKSARFTRRNAETREKASSHGQPWSDAELEVIARPDLTDYEAGLLIGRTMQAVKRARQTRGIAR